MLDHRTDIYSLGVTLYELLTLSPPLPATTGTAPAPVSIEDDPRPPRQLNPCDPQDLETIVLRRWPRSRRARYATAQELADDLRRFLEDKPIRARRPSLAGRLAKWSQRHLTVVWSAVVLLLLATVGLAVSTALVSREQAQTVQALTRAEENLRDARDTVNDYLIRVSEDKLLGIPPMRQLREQLLRLALVYYEKFVDQYGEDPTLQAELADALFRVGSITAQTDSTEGGLLRASEVHLEALEIRKRLAEEHPDAGEYQTGLALSYSAIGALEWGQGNWREARGAFQEATRIWEDLAAGDSTVARYGRDIAQLLQPRRP